MKKLIYKKWFRDPKTWLHTNGGESEINRMKAWMRKKYASLKGQSKDTDSHDPIIATRLDEFIFLKNVGDDMATIIVPKEFVFDPIFNPRAWVDRDNL